MKKLSVVGKDYHTEENVVGFYTAGDRMKFWGKLGAFWGGLWGILFGSAGLYLAMGWLIVIAIRPLWLKVPLPGILLLLAGGIAYTAGVAFYAAERIRYSHFVWHLFVVIGTTCHFFAVLWYAA